MKGLSARWSRNLRHLASSLVAGLLAAAAPLYGGYDEGIGALNRGDYTNALAELRPLAERGDPKAQWALAYMYRRGLGVPKDPTRADQWERRASQVVGGPVRATPAAPAPRSIATPGTAGTGPAMPVPQGQVASTGSGLVVDETGRVLTNHHVVQGCRSLRVGADGALRGARLSAYDPTTDLALLDVPGSKALRPAVFRDNAAAELGEGVLLAGFPLQGVLSSDLHVASGMVSALAGPGGDRRLVQLSAPVHPGNSGGPVLDLRGQVIGVLSGTLDSGRIEQMTGLPPQSVGFAVRGDAVQRFLRKTGVPIRSGGSSKPLDSKELAARAKRFTVLVQCLR